MTDGIPSPWYKDGKFQNLGPEPEKKEEPERPDIFFEFSSELRSMIEEELEGRGFVYIVLDDSVPCSDVKNGGVCNGKHKFIGWSMNIAPEEVMRVVQEAVKLFDFRRFRKNDGNSDSAPAI